MAVYEKSTEVPIDPSIARLRSFREVVEYDRRLVSGKAIVRWERGEIVVDVPHPFEMFMRLVDQLRINTSGLRRGGPVLQHRLSSSRG